MAKKTQITNLEQRLNAAHQEIKKLGVVSISISSPDASAERAVEIIEDAVAATKEVQEFFKSRGE